MSKPNNDQKLSRSKEKLLRQLITPPVLIPGENAADFHALAKAVYADLDVQTTAEAFLVRDVIACEWEIQRFRRIQAALLTPSPGDPVMAALTASIGEKMLGGARPAPTAAEREAEQLQGIARLFMQRNDEIEQVSRIIAALEPRRNNAHREFEKRREKPARPRRPAPEAVIEPEYVTVPRKAA
jgi:hypothetical protein